MSRVELAPSYLASQPLPAWCGTMRGATAPTAGSAKCGSRPVSQPGCGHAVGVQERDEFRLRRREAGVARGGRAAVDRPVDDGGAAGSRDARDRRRVGGRVVDDDHPRRGSAVVGRPRARRPARQRSSSACRSRTGITTVTSAAARRRASRSRPPRAVRRGEVRGGRCPRRAGGGPATRAAVPAGTGVPANQAATCREPAGVSRSTRTGDPPTSTDPPATSRVPGSGTRPHACRGEVAVTRRAPAGRPPGSTGEGAHVRAPPPSSTRTRDSGAAVKPARGLSSQSCDGGRRRGDRHRDRARAADGARPRRRRPVRVVDRRARRGQRGDAAADASAVSP